MPLAIASIAQPASSMKTDNKSEFPMPRGITRARSGSRRAKYASWRERCNIIIAATRRRHDSSAQTCRDVAEKSNMSRIIWGTVGFVFFTRFAMTGSSSLPLRPTRVHGVGEAGEECLSIRSHHTRRLHWSMGKWPRPFSHCLPCNCVCLRPLTRFLALCSRSCALLYPEATSARSVAGGRGAAYQITPQHPRALGGGGRGDDE